MHSHKSSVPEISDARTILVETLHDLARLARFHLNHYPGAFSGREALALLLYHMRLVPYSSIYSTSTIRANTQFPITFQAGHLRRRPKSLFSTWMAALLVSSGLTMDGAMLTMDSPGDVHIEKGQDGNESTKDSSDDGF